MSKVAIWVHGTFDSPIISEATGKGWGVFGGAGDSSEAKHSLHPFHRSGYSQPGTRTDRDREHHLLRLLWGKGLDSKDECYAFVWSGHANESSRRHGGEKLAERIRELKQKIPGCTIAIAGHSHGGNVIGHALNADVELEFAKTYLFSTPFFGSWGRGIWLSSTSVRKRAGEKRSFVHPNDAIQRMGAAIAGGWSSYNTCFDFESHIIKPNWQAQLLSPHGSAPAVTGATSHTSMSSAQAFHMAWEAIGSPSMGWNGY